MIRGILFVMVILLLVGTARPDDRLLVHTDFHAPFKEVRISEAGGDACIMGGLPEGWRDNSLRVPKVHVEYQRVSENNESFLRIHKRQGTHCQVIIALPSWEKEAAYCRLQFRARSSTWTTTEFGICFADDPSGDLLSKAYRWAFKPYLEERWKDYRYKFRLAASSQPLEFWITLTQEGEGIVDISEFSLVCIKREDLVREIRQKFPDGGQKRNLVRISRFPLGMQSGMLLQSTDDDEEVEITSDPSITGPSGAPALRMQSGRAFKLSLPPFPVPWSFKKHTLSAYVRGTVGGRLVVTADDRDLAAVSFDPGEERWVRLSLTFDPVLEGAVHAARIEPAGGGLLWMDGLMVEPGRRASPYEPPAPCEIALQLIEDRARSTRIVFDDEDGMMFKVVGTYLRGSLVRVKVVNLYGQERMLPPMELTPESKGSGRFSFKVFPERPYGAFRIEAWVEDADRGRLSPFSEMVVNALRRPHYYGQDAPESPFGVHVNPVRRHLLMAKAVGLNWVRLHNAGMNLIGWSFLEPEKGEWVFSDDRIEKYRRHRFKILGHLATAPGWATGFPGPVENYWDRWYEPCDYQEFADYVRKVVSRYKGIIDVYEIWNEPWGRFWVRYDPKEKDRIRVPTAAEDYVRLQEAAFASAKSVDPGVTILGLNTCPCYNGPLWSRKVFAAGAEKSCDAFAYHRYTDSHMGYGGDEIDRAGLMLAAAPFIQRDGLLKMDAWMTEGNNFFNSSRTGFYHHTLPLPNHDDFIRAADMEARFLVRMLADGARKVFLYTMHYPHHFTGRERNRLFWAVLSMDGYLHPSGAAVSNAAWHLEDTTFSKRIRISKGIWAYLFEGDSRAASPSEENCAHGKTAYSVAVLMNKPGSSVTGLSLPEQAVAVDLFGNSLQDGPSIKNTMIYISLHQDVRRMESLLRQIYLDR
ncbi:MAG: hypothetical protein ACYTG7_12350 [Planctomycetota bacterium]|jgi:hypothetical protein